MDNNWTANAQQLFSAYLINERIFYWLQAGCCLGRQYPLGRKRIGGTQLSRTGHRQSHTGRKV